MVHGARQTGSADGGTRGSGTSSRVKVRGRCAVPPALRQQTLVSPSCHTAVAGWPQRCSRLWLMLRQLLGPSCPGTRAPGASLPAACSLVDGGRRRPGRRSPHSLSCPCCSEVAAHASASACALPWPKQVPSQRNVSEGRRKCMLERRDAFCRSHSFVHRMLSASAASEIDLWKWIWSLASRSLQSNVGHKR